MEGVPGHLAECHIVVWGPEDRPCKIPLCHQHAGEHMCKDDPAVYSYTTTASQGNSCCRPTAAVLLFTEPSMEAYPAFPPKGYCN